MEPAAGSPVTESFEVPTQALVGGSPGGEDAALQRTDVFDMGEELAEIALCETDDPGEIERLMRHAAERDPRGTPVGP